MKIVAAVLLFAFAGTLPAPAADPLNSLRFLVGTWNCSYQAGKTRVQYRATFAYDMGSNWLRETDTWTGGGGDLGMFTYERNRGWTAVVLERDRHTVIMRATGNDPNHVVYRSVYPDASMTDIFERASPTRYTLHFTQTLNGKTMKSTDTCVKT
jgi:hypothetical protein